MEMSESQYYWTLVIGLGLGFSLLIALGWDPATRILRRSGIDPEKGFKLAGIIGVAVFVLIGIAMSILVMLKVLHVI